MCFHVCCIDHWIATSSSMGKISIVDQRNGYLLRSWKAHNSTIVRVLAVDDSHILSIGKDGKAVLWDLYLGSQHENNHRSVV